MYLHKNNLQKCYRHKFRYKGVKKIPPCSSLLNYAWWLNSLLLSSKGLAAMITYTLLFFQ